MSPCMWSQFTVICLPFNRNVQQFSSCMPCTKLLQLLVHLTMLKSSAMSLVQPLPCRTVKNVTCMLSVVITSAVVPLIRILHAELRTVQLAVRRATRRAELHKLKSGVLGILQHNLDTLVQKLQRSHKWMIGTHTECHRQPQTNLNPRQVWAIFLAEGVATT